MAITCYRADRLFNVLLKSFLMRRMDLFLVYGTIGELIKSQGVYAAPKGADYALQENIGLVIMGQQSGKVTFFAALVTGIACILQGWIGHRYPLLEGPSGMIWGMMLTLGTSAPSLGLTMLEVGGGSLQECC